MADPIAWQPAASNGTDWPDGNLIVSSPLDNPTKGFSQLRAQAASLWSMTGKGSLASGTLGFILPGDMMVRSWIIQYVDVVDEIRSTVKLPEWNWVHAKSPWFLSAPLLSELRRALPRVFNPFTGKTAVFDYASGTYSLSSTWSCGSFGIDSNIWRGLGYNTDAQIDIHLASGDASVYLQTFDPLGSRVPPDVFQIRFLEDAQSYLGAGDESNLFTLIGGGDLFCSVSLSEMDVNGTAYTYYKSCTIDSGTYSTYDALGTTAEDEAPESPKAASLFARLFYSLVPQS
jgi:hypothetical protein